MLEANRLAGRGGGGTAGAGGSFTREASLKSESCKLTVKSDKDPDLT